MKTMKRIFLVVAVFSSLFLLTGCGDSPEKEELSKYLNEDMTVVLTLQDDLLKSLESVTGENATTDQALYNELNTKTLVLARELSDEAKKIGENIKNEKLVEVHNAYIKYADTMLASLTLLEEAAKTSNASKGEESNTLMQEAVKYADEYAEKLESLSKEYE